MAKRRKSSNLFIYLKKLIFENFFKQDNRWLFGRIQLRGNIEQTVGQPYQLVIEGIVGNGFQGDISVDDLAVNQGPCPASSKFFIFLFLIFLFYFFQLFVISKVVIYVVMLMIQQIQLIGNVFKLELIHHYHLLMLHMVHHMDILYF